MPSSSARHRTAASPSGSIARHQHGEVIAFPKTQTAADLLTDAPTEVSEAQLRELHVRVRLPQP